MSKQLSLFQNGTIGLDRCRVAWLQDIFDLPSTEVDKESSTDYARELTKVASMVNFFYYYQYDNDIMKILSPEVRAFIRKNHSKALPSSPERTYLLRGDVVLNIDNYIDRNLLPHIQIADTCPVNDNFVFKESDQPSEITINGWNADTINAHDFLLCTDLIARLADNSNIIDDIVELLYPHPSAAQGWVKELDVDIKYAILFNFQCFSNFLFNRTRFKILFTPSKKKKTTSSELVLNIDNLYALAKKGYGSAIELEKITMNQYLTVLLGELKDTARTMHAYKKSAVTIANDLNIDLKYILQWID